MKLSRDAELLWVQINLMGHSSAASAPTGEFNELIIFPKVVFCQVPRVGIKESFALLRNCQHSRSALPGTYRREEKKKKKQTLLPPTGRTPPKDNWGVSSKGDTNVETNRLSDVCVDLNSNVGSVALNQGCGNPVLKGHNPAGLSVLPGQK